MGFQFIYEYNLQDNCIKEHYLRDLNKPGGRRKIERRDNNSLHVLIK